MGLNLNKLQFHICKYLSHYSLIKLTLESPNGCKIYQPWVRLGAYSFLIFQQWVKGPSQRPAFKTMRKSDKIQLSLYYNKHDSYAF